MTFTSRVAGNPSALLFTFAASLFLAAVAFASCLAPFEINLPSPPSQPSLSRTLPSVSRIPSMTPRPATRQPPSGTSVAVPWASCYGLPRPQCARSSKPNHARDCKYLRGKTCSSHPPYAPSRFYTSGVCFDGRFMFSIGSAPLPAPHVLPVSPIVLRGPGS